MRKLAVIPAVVLSAACVLANAGQALAGGGPTTRYVDDDGSATAASCDGQGGASQTIGGAILASDIGDRISVCPGTYVERIVVGATRDGLEIFARFRRTAIIRAPANLSGAQTLVRIQGDRVSLTGFIVEARGGSSSCQRVPVMVSAEGGSAQIRDNEIRATGGPTWSSCGYSVGIRVGGGIATGGARPSVDENTVRNWRDVGIVVRHDARVTDNRLRFVHRDGTTCTGGSGAVPVCTGSAGILVDGLDVTLDGNIVEPPETVQPLAKIAVGIHLRALGTEEHTVKRNRVTYTDVNLTLDDVDASVIEENILTRGRHGIRVINDSDDNLIRDNRSTTHGVWDCFQQGSTGNTWTNNIGLKDSPESLCIDP